VRLSEPTYFGSLSVQGHLWNVGVRLPYFYMFLDMEVLVLYAIHPSLDTSTSDILAIYTMRE
jgi:hypothetical protein